MDLRRICSSARHRAASTTLLTMASLLKDLKNKLTGGKGYSDNLLGQSLEDQFRIATAKTLEAPDATTNQQVGSGSTAPPKPNVSRDHAASGFIVTPIPCRSWTPSTRTYRWARTPG